MEGLENLWFLAKTTKTINNPEENNIKSINVYISSRQYIR